MANADVTGARSPRADSSHEAPSAFVFLVAEDGRLLGCRGPFQTEGLAERLDACAAELERHGGGNLRVHLRGKVRP